MGLKQELISILGVPENWDKYDFQIKRYSFEDIQEVLEEINEEWGITSSITVRWGIESSEPSH